MKYLQPVSRALLLVAAIVAVSLPASASAASNSLGVNPRRNYTVAAGKSISDTLTVTNLSKTETLQASVEVIDFGAKDETGAPGLILDKSQPTRWSLRPYLKLAPSVRVEPGKSVSLPFTIAIPANVGAGSYYGAVKYSTGSTTGPDNLSLTSSSSTLVFVRVPGKATSSLFLKTFGAFTPTDSQNKSGRFNKLFFGTAPRYLSYRLENRGNLAEQPSGSIVIKNAVGKTVKTIEKANPNDSLVLIGQTRRLDSCINSQKVTHNDSDTGQTVEEQRCDDPGLLPGRYTAELALIYGDDGSADSGGYSHELRAATSFWYVPVWFVIALAAGLIVLVVVVILVVRKLRNRKHYHGGRR